jgi:hypothetical protein
MKQIFKTSLPTYTHMPNHRRTLTLERLSQSQSQSYFTTDGLPPISSSWRQSPWGSLPEFSFQLNTCGHSAYVTSSLTRGWVCRLQMLLALASAVILGSESRGTHNHIFCCLRFETPKPGGPGPLTYIPQEQSGPVINPGTVFLISSPPTTRRATVEVFEPASTRASKTEFILNNT